MNRSASILCLIAFVSLWARGARAEPANIETAATIAVIETRVVGVLPTSGDAVTRQLYATVGRLGYRTVPETVTAALAAQLAPFGNAGLAPAQLLRVATETHANRAIAATLGTRDGRYVVSLVLANADLSGPFYANASADAVTLEATVDALARKLLPAAPPPSPPTPNTDTAEEKDGARADEDLGPRLAIQTEGAFGLGRHFFYNHLAGARLDYVFPGNFSIGAYLGYANLKGKDGRTSNVLPYAQLEYRIHGSSTSSVWVPVRFGSGFLPKNGPFVRMTAGLSFPLSGSTRLGLDLLAPTVWIVKDSTVFSMDVAAEVSFDL